MIAKQKSWAPAPMTRMPLPKLGQQVQQAQVPRSSLSSKEIALVTDAAVLAGSAFMVWAYTEEKNDASIFWWIASGVMVMKILHDSSRPY